ncbi:hypothetical protein [Streptomyces heilongjiangensis]|uniref:Uncharacterized protein n=1 Tax=Streptomyces heilongjiangensis TaxID=945052 RepID=A0ABW1BBZ7_9ACTN|nr:hypothetical protein [Streptomyces heilongjiangensis]MDC2952087.1 hypothetical protein [Streptomyces heilongjiangensis]
MHFWPKLAPQGYPAPPATLKDFAQCSVPMSFRQPGTWCRDCRAERDRRTAEVEAVSARAA